MAENEPILKGVKYIVPVASGKGGVGKSTLSANLAVSLANQGFKVGLMDADVYGPSIPMLMGAEEQPKQEGQKIIPPECFGVKIISMGFFLPKDDAVIWRGPMLHKMIEQFLGLVEWGELDYLIVDLPPGTGDIQLSLCQSIRLTGAVIVSTPQDLAFSVAEKAITMFNKLKTPIIGLVENMSGEVFGKGNGEKYANEKEIPFLGDIPLSVDIRVQSDRGKPVCFVSPDSDSAKAFTSIAENLNKILESSPDKSEQNQFIPQNISQPSEDLIKIEWKDGAVNELKALDVRAACMCAKCVDEMTGKRNIPKELLDPKVHVKDMSYVGNYGVSFQWSDGHGSGIYSFDYLKKLVG